MLCMLIPLGRVVGQAETGDRRSTLGARQRNCSIPALPVAAVSLHQAFCIKDSLLVVSR